MYFTSDLKTKLAIQRWASTAVKHARPRDVLKLFDHQHDCIARIQRLEPHEPRVSGGDDDEEEEDDDDDDGDAADDDDDDDDDGKDNDGEDDGEDDDDDDGDDDP